MIFLAKSDGLELNIHSEYVSKAALYILKSSISNDLYDKFSEVIRISALLHDIGKVTKSFQKFLLKDKDNNEEFKYLHNQIGCAFLSKYLDIDDQSKRFILDAVHWHHGVSIKSGFEQSNAEILKDIDNDDIESMKMYLSSVLGEHYLLKTPSYDYTVIRNYFIFDNSKSNSVIENINYILIRSCVIGADRLISKFSKDELSTINIKDEVDRTLLRENKTQTLTTIYDGSDRFIKQQSIIESTNKTSIINAPAGFGKTVLGLLWGITKNNKKIIWVCPRNMVAESVYNSILSELNSFNLNMSVELFLGGEVKKQNKEICNGFDSDIIVTNIDNFLFTTTNNNKLNYLYLTNNINVVFDEYHELVTDSALMSLFVLIMNLRHNMLESETLLLSATDVPIYKLWINRMGSPNTILPNEFKHYEAAHTKKYKLNIVESPIRNEYNTLTIFNSIKESQIEKYNTKTKTLIHSKYEQSERDIQFEYLIGLYGKNSDMNVDKENVIGTHVIQASLDVSFKILNESILSPQSTLQRIGRCDRWGNCSTTPVINIFKSDSKSEKSTVKVIYDENLNNKWYDVMKDYDGQSLSLDDLYNIYDEFSKLYFGEIYSYIKTVYNKSLNNLKDIYPIKNIFKTTKGDIKKSTSNKLRCKGNEIFVIYKKTGGSKYTEPFNQEIYVNTTTDFKEDERTLYRMKKDMKRINDNRFDYKYLDNKNKFEHTTIDKLKENATKSNQPYIRYDCVYHDEYGIIDLETLNIIKK